MKQYDTDDETALNFFINKNGTINSAKTSKKFIDNNFTKYKELFLFLDNKFNNLSIHDNLTEILYCIKHKIYPQKCCICGKPAVFYGFQRGYSLTCSYSCHCKHQMNIRLSSEDFLNKQQEKLKLKHPEYFYNWNIVSDVNDKWVLEHFIRYNRTNFCPDTNKLENGSWSKNEKNKMIIRYVLSRFNKPTIEENLYWLYHKLEYDPICPVCGNKLKFINFIHGYQRVCSHSCAALHPETREKLIKTNNEKYGSDFYLGTNECINKSKKTLVKKYESGNFLNYKQNSPTVYCSKGELHLLNILKEKYPDVKTYYRDKRYSNPRNNYQWECDFYIPSLDLFIEYQGFRSHGPHPYNKHDPEDIKTLNEWKTKLENKNIKESTKSLIRADINGWTKHDVFKRNIAKKNNLNFIEIFERNIKKITKEYVYSLIDKYLEE